MQSIHVDTFDDWRDAARRLLASGVSPTDVQWIGGAERSLFASDAPTVSPDASTAATVPNVPKAFLELARYVASHRASGRWSLLYRTLWRLTHGERHLLQVTTDDDVHQLMQMRKGVSRDIHKMKAFVRFRKLETGGAEEQFVAWHRPDHRIVRLAAPFFARRFSGMHWSILTPDESVTWDQTSLHYGPGVPASEAPDEDALEDLWKAYYASIFNPARVKVAAMKREMPVRHWPTLPEATLIDDLLRQAPARADAMIQTNEGFAETAAHFMPERGDLVSLRHAAATCRACSLHQCATQTVFGEGSPSARIVLVGEQPGDREDIEAHPFVGPAGKLLDEALKQAGIDRRDVYITNVVKHFKFMETETPRGKRRLHQKPDSREIYACRPWLEAELAAIGPQVIVCLGATAAQALFGRDFGITKDRGKVMRTDWCDITIATWHPAAILRMQDAVRQAQMRTQLVDDLASVS
ncbi:UdgX family uracil-DNA binding protein [Rosistilla oblonga]|uniref:UdgX family uracil-DNA binding protein n=1 Tax=Rosistilla oblonga TaxID=2527990 RepID=UPI003A97802E